MQRTEEITNHEHPHKDAATPTALLLVTLRRMFVGVFVAALTLGLPQWAAACPTCKNDLHRSGMEVGFAISILFMIAVPFCIFTAWTIAILRMTKSSPVVESNSLLPDSSQQDSGKSRRRSD